MYLLIFLLLYIRGLCCTDVPCTPSGVNNTLESFTCCTVPIEIFRVMPTADIQEDLTLVRPWWVQSPLIPWLHVLHILVRLSLTSLIPVSFVEDEMCLRTYVDTS
jgi:hypothetical protein